MSTYKCPTHPRAKEASSDAQLTIRNYAMKSTRTVVTESDIRCNLCAKRFLRKNPGAANNLGRIRPRGSTQNFKI